MPRPGTLRLNTHFVARRIAALDVKQWWLARQVGVDRKTVSRWATGKVKRIAPENAETLASLLDCSLDELTLSDDADLLATHEEQRAAARLIREHGLVAKLSPTDDWKLAEGVIRAAMTPELPLVDLGHLYTSLSTVEWRQGRYVDARVHALRAAEIAEQVGDRLLAIAAAFDLAVIDSFLGESASALAAYERVLAIPESFHTPAGRAATWSNAGCLYRSFLRFEESLAAQREAIRRYAALGTDYNLAIAWTSLGVAAAESGALDDALAAFETAERHAAASRYTRGVTSARIYLADVLALRGDAASARTLVAANLADLNAYEVYDLTAHECAARVLRLAGDVTAAREEIHRGIERAARFPEIRGLMLEELARIEQVADDSSAAAEARRGADQAFSAAGLRVRVHEGPTPEYGSATSPQVA